MSEGRRLELEARAKLNLRLRVLARREDGYHAVESLYLRLALADELELEADGEPGIRLELEGEGAASEGTASVPAGPGNLAWKAAERFCELIGEEPALTLRLRKRIPAGAGLGGGSADAAAVLRGLNELAGRPLTEEALLRAAAGLGSDVPFLAAGVPAALGWGRGERLLPLPVPPPRPMVLAVPDARIGAAEAYRWIDEDREADRPSGRPGDGAAEEPGDGLPGVEEEGGAGGELLPPTGAWDDWSTLEELAGNDFERSVFARLPELGWWKEELEGEGARLALLCGSGSALAGVFADPDRRDAAARRLEAAETVQVIRTRGPV